MVKRKKNILCLFWKRPQHAVGKGVIDTGCSRCFIGPTTLEKWKRKLTKKWCLNIKLEKAMTFRFGNDETLKPRLWPYSCWNCWCQWSTACARGAWRSTALVVERIVERPKFGVRAVVTSKQSPQLLLPLTSSGPQGHKIPGEIQPRIRSDECAIHRATCNSSRQEKIHSWIASQSDRRSPETDSTDTESQYGTDGHEQHPCDETRDSRENRKGRWVRVHGIARRTPVDPMHDKQPSCQDLTERRRTTVKFLGQHPNSGHVICHRTTPGNLTDITAT